MDAVKIIEQHKRLPEEEKQKVEHFIQETAFAREPSIRFADEAEASKGAAEVFREHPELFRKLSQ